MSTEHAIRPPHPGLHDCPRAYLGGKPEPARAQAINKTGEPFALEIQLLQLKMQERIHSAEQQVVAHEAVELMPVNGKVPAAGKVPHIFPKYPDTNQVRHYMAQPAVMITLYPHDLYSALWI
jgi:hypothetical protein